MTITAQSPHPGSGPGGERPTEGLGSPSSGESSQFALLASRTFRHTVTRLDAPAGRYLAIEDGANVRLIPLERPIIHIGRGLTADVRLEDPQVSRRHAIVAQRGDGVRILDDRSSNGTFLNGRVVTVAPMHDGDVLRIGRVVFRLVEIAPPGKPSPVRRRTRLPVRASGALLERAV